MKKIIRITFDTENDMKILKAVKKFIGQTSDAERIKRGLTEQEAELCSEFYCIDLGEDEEDENT